MLELKNISKSYKDNRVLTDVDLSVNAGEMVVLLGPSGSGKTTILRLIAGFLDLNEGEILVDGVNINTIEAHKRNIGVVFQDYALFPHMTVEQNVDFGLKMRRLPAHERKKRMEEALSCVGLAGYGARYPHQLSGGQQQRVAIARVVAIRAKVMLLDEPLSNLDAKLRRQVRVELKELQRNLNITTLIVTHDQEEAMTIGDRIAILNDGVIQQVGTPMSLYQEPANKFVAGFLGTPSINFMDMRVEEGKVYIMDVGFDRAAIDQKINIADGEFILGIRPENLALHHTNMGGNYLEARLSLVEHLGAESLAYFNLNGNHYCCRTAFDESLEQGQDIFVEIDFASVTAFDKNTENNIIIK